MKPIFEYHVGGKKYLGFADGEMAIEDSPFTGNIVVNRAGPVLNLLYGLAEQYGRTDIMDSVREYYPERYKK